MSYQEHTNSAVQTGALTPGSFAALQQRIESLTKRARGLAVNINNIRGTLIGGTLIGHGAPLEAGSQIKPKAVPAGFIDAADATMDDLTQALNDIEDDIESINKKL